MRRIFITGVNGFVGKHLVRQLKHDGCQVVGVGHEAQSHVQLAGELADYFSCDLTDAQAVARVPFQDATAVIHLAGLSSQAQSFTQPRECIDRNSAMVINIFESLLAKHAGMQTRFVVASSGAVYASDQSMPLTEDSRVAYNSPYVISKLLVEQLTHYYQTRGFDCVLVRPFNHTGPGQGDGFILPDLTKQAMQAQATGQPMSVGNLQTRRDYSDVRDVVRAYSLLATTSNLRYRLYNVSSGKSVAGAELLDAIFQALGSSKPDTTIDQSRIRPNDPPEIYGDHTRLTTDTGWRPEIPLTQTVADFIKASQD